MFTPTEGAGAGAFIGLIMAILKGMRLRGIIEAILSVGRTSAPILVLLVTAQLYSRTLAMTGVTNAIQDFFLGSGMGPALILVAMVGIWFLLGMVIDSISIMLLTVTIFEPIAVKIGYDPIAFAIIGILAIEAGLLTPPFGLDRLYRQGGGRRRRRHRLGDIQKLDALLGHHADRRGADRHVPEDRHLAAQPGVLSRRTYWHCRLAATQFSLLSAIMNACDRVRGSQGHGLTLDTISLAILLGSLLVLAGILSSLIALRFGAPLLLVFLMVGMLAGEGGPGGLKPSTTSRRPIRSARSRWR